MVIMNDARALPCPLPWRGPDGTPNPVKRTTGTATITEVDGVAGLLIPTRQPSRAAGIVLVVVGLVLGGLAALLFVLGGVALGFGGGVLGLLGLLLLLAGAFSLRGKPKKVGIVLTPGDVVLTWLRPVVRVPWDAISEVRPLAVRLGKARTSASRHYVGLIAKDVPVADRVRALAAKFGKDVTCVIAMGMMNIDQLVVLTILRYYRDNPDARAELGGPDAVRRVAGLGG